MQGQAYTHTYAHKYLRLAGAVYAYALPELRQDITYPCRIFCMQGTKHLLAFARALGAVGFVHVSTAYVNRVRQFLPCGTINEQHYPLKFGNTEVRGNVCPVTCFCPHARIRRVPMHPACSLTDAEPPTPSFACAYAWAYNMYLCAGSCVMFL